MPLSSSLSPALSAAPACQPLHRPSLGHPGSHSGPSQHVRKTGLFRHFSIMSFFPNINNVVLDIVRLLVLTYYCYFKHIGKHREAYDK